MGKLTISMAMFNSKLLVHQRVWMFPTRFSPNPNGLIPRFMAWKMRKDRSSASVLGHILKGDEKPNRLRWPVTLKRKGIVNTKPFVVAVGG